MSDEYKKLSYDSYREDMRSFGQFDENSSFVVAVSGGADSLALTFLLADWCKKNNIKLSAVTVDHGLRQGSAKEAESVNSLLKKNNINHIILRWIGDKKSSNIQAEARDARYKLITDFCKDNNAKFLFVAHNKQDQAETVLLRLMRGSGVDGLSGIAEDSQINGVRVIRPLLSYSKNEIRAFLRQEGHEWIEDPSNENIKYARVNVRKFIESAEDSDLLIDRLAETSLNLRRSRDYIETKMSQDCKEVFFIKSEGYCILDWKKFNSLHEEVAYRLLSSIVKIVGGEYYKPRFEKIKTLYYAIKDNNLAGGNTLGGCIIFSDKNKEHIVIARELSSIRSDIKIEPGQKVFWDNRFSCELDGQIKNSYTISNLGQEGLKQITDSGLDISEIFYSKKIIYSLPALKILEKIVAVPQINYYNDSDLQDAISIKFVYEENSFFK